MNDKTENIKHETAIAEPVGAEELAAENYRQSSRKIYIVGGLIVVSVAALLVWIFVSRGQEGKAVTAPRNVSFDETTDDNTLNSGEKTMTISPEQLKAAGLKIEKVGEGLSRELSAASATGVVQANAYAQTPVVSLVGGVVRQINAELGQFVGRGQTVAVVFSDELAQTASNYLSKRAAADEANKRYERALKLTAIASESNSEIDEATRQVKTVESELAEYQSNYRRTEQLVEIGAASRQDFEQARTKLQTAQAQLVEANKRLERAKKLLNINPARRAELDNALTQLRTAQAETASMRQKLLVLGLPSSRVNSLTSSNQINAELPIQSPVAGTVTARDVNPGEIIAANKEILRVTNLSMVWVIGQVYEKDLAQLKAGSGVSVTSDSYPGELFRGNISYIDPNLDQNTRTAQVRIELPNPDQKFKIGMYVNIAFATIGGSENTVPMISKKAVQTINNQQIVFVATDNPNVFVLRVVKTGAENNGFYPILEGLTVGENIVTEGSFLLRAEWQKLHPN